MKTDNELYETMEYDSTTVVKNKIGTIVYISLFPFISALTILFAGYIKNMEMLDMLRIGITVFLLATALMFFIRFQDSLLNIKFSKTIILVSYFLPILLIMLLKNPVIYCFWIIGGLLLAMLIDSRIGLLVYFNHTIILSISFSLKLDTTIYLLIMGVLFVLLSGALKNKSTVIYAAIILLSSNITLLFIMNNFIFETDTNVDYLTSFFCILAVLAAAFLLSFLYDKIANKDNDISEYELKNNTDTVQSHVNEKAGYDILLSEDNELLIRIKEHSEVLYKHSVIIGDLSEKAARVIGADAALAKAGGFYHEAGKIMGKNYIEEGLKLADEYAFPEKLKLILRQHNIKHDKPTFIESAIVMLSDNIASTIDYIEKSGDNKFSSDMIIDNIFKMRMEKGTFDDSGLTVKDFKLLKEFYQNQYNNVSDGN